MTEKQMTEQESLQLITEMIGKAKKSVHETGTSAILWGSVITLCGVFSFVQLQWLFLVTFNVWFLALLALVPQIFISIRESRQIPVRTHTQEALRAVWLVYMISIFALIFYFNVVPGQTDRFLELDGTRVQMRLANGLVVPYKTFIPSFSSLLLLLYGIPTLTTGLAHRFSPMVIGGVLCFCFFVLSCFTVTKWDYLLNGLAGTVNWLIPGLILRRRYLKGKRTLDV